MSVVFDFNASLNDAAPVSPMLLSVDVNQKEKSELLMDVSCVSFFLLSSRFRLSLVSVVFDFNDSLNDVAPLSPMSLTVDVLRKEKSELLMDFFCVSLFVLSSLHRYSSTSVVFDFNASLNDVVPVSLMPLSVDAKESECEWLVDVFCVLFLLSFPLR